MSDVHQPCDLAIPCLIVTQEEGEAVPGELVHEYLNSSICSI